MKTNLVFRRNITIEGVNKVEMKIVPVELSSINSNEGWILQGHTDIIEIIEDKVAPLEEEERSSNESKILSPGAKFISNVPGTAKLVRRGNKIFIAYRRGKTTFNQTTPNSVCISDSVKIKFFNDCKKVFGSNCTSFSFNEGDSLHDYWSAFIDQEYLRQLKECKNHIE